MYCLNIYATSIKSIYAQFAARPSEISEIEDLIPKYHFHVCMSLCLHLSLYTSLYLLLYISISTHVFFQLYISHCISLFLLISIYSFEYLDISLYIFPSAYIPMSPLYKSQVLPPIIFFYMDLLSSV